MSMIQACLIATVDSEVNWTAALESWHGKEAKYIRIWEKQLPVHRKL